jgi:ABC-type dipeptide/oligopeptide/nickel transport system ATPase component
MSFSVRNFYNHIDKKFNVKAHNPNYSKHGINVPFRMMIIGASGTGKTNTLMNIMYAMSNTFNRIVICCKSKEEPIYQQLEHDHADIEFNEGGEIPDIENFSDYHQTKAQTLMIFDDLVNEKDQRMIQEYFIRGRKYGISMIYITQSYFASPKKVRQQCNYFILKKLSNRRDLSSIIRDFPVDSDDTKSMYQAMISRGKLEDFIMIDLEKNRIRYNFLL